MQQYLDLLTQIKNTGNKKISGRAGMPDTLSIFGHQMKFDLSKGFPLLTTKKVSLKMVALELIWFLRGDTNIKYLVENGCHIWNDDAFNYMQKKASEQSVDSTFPNNDEGKKLFTDCIKSKEIPLPVGGAHPNIKDFYWGDCGEQYGKLWRDWGGKEYSISPSLPNEKIAGIDQITNLINGLKTNPEGRRHIVTAWNPETLHDMALNACHTEFQVNCRKLTPKERWECEDEDMRSPTYESFVTHNKDKGVEEVNDTMNKPKYKMDLRFTMRSTDTILGAPFNIASYSLLTHILCRMLNMIPGIVTAQFSDTHIYENHMEAVEEQLQRVPEKLPILGFDKDFDLNVENFQKGEVNLDEFINYLCYKNFAAFNYFATPLKAETKLSTGTI